ncbi:hypothetical protein BCR43DRAFT_499464 [Syncephalastrum racemosum]|uniref:Uncharacterized protein n=1 Tax=Syncephalastrum racemosum TaxID=13706 RepID=A0A1X2H0D9_SYNRA|nr:hypothetical protein BCR43DRAFT_499464 [Syncephalastrum racemosum]
MYVSEVERHQTKHGCLYIFGLCSNCASFVRFVSVARGGFQETRSTPLFWVRIPFEYNVLAGPDVCFMQTKRSCDAVKRSLSGRAHIHYLDL